MGLLKQLLRKVLGRASLDREHLETVICDCESIINSRPLTYTSSDTTDLAPLAPVMFLRDQSTVGVPDCDAVDQNSLCRKIVYRQRLLENLRSRFRNEYLGQLKLWSKSANHHQIQVGELVLVGNDQDKRLNWPLGRVVQIFPGKDGRVRLVKVVTARGQFLRPVQRLYPLECAVFQSDVKEDAEGESSLPAIRLSAEMTVSESNTKCAKPVVLKSRVPETKPSVVTRSGRLVKVPSRYSDKLE